MRDAAPPRRPCRSSTKGLVEVQASLLFVTIAGAAGVTAPGWRRRDVNA